MTILDKIKSNIKLFLLILAGLLIFALVIFVLSNIKKTENNLNIDQTKETKQNFLDDNFYSNILLTGKGNKETGKYVTVLSDYACAWSAKFYKETISSFINFKDEVNKIWLQYDFLVLDENSPSLLPTEGAYCANEYGKFWEFHDGVFKLRDQFDSIEEAFKEENIINLAKNLNIYTDQYKNCMNEHKYKELILMRANYYLDAMDKLGVPSTFLNGKAITLSIDGKEQAVGAIDLNIFTQKIQQWLNNK